MHNVLRPHALDGAGFVPEDAYGPPDHDVGQAFAAAASWCARVFVRPISIDSVLA